MPARKDLRTTGDGYRGQRMQMTRRGFLKGIAGILAAGVAPAVIGSPILMPVRKIWTPPINPRIFTISNPGGSSSLLMSIFVEDERGRRVWSQKYTPPMPLTKGETIIALPEDRHFVSLTASWTEA